MKDNRFFDTNIIYYAYDISEPVKRDACKALVEEVFEGKATGIVSNQVLGELFSALVTKLDVKTDEAELIVEALVVSERWKKLNYTDATIKRAIKKFSELKAPFWDLVIAETMRENGVSEIITENEKDFRNIPGITVINPFK